MTSKPEQAQRDRSNVGQRRRTTRRLWLLAFIALFFAGAVPLALSYRQDALDAALIDAIKGHNPGAVRTLLSQGARANAVYRPPAYAVLQARLILLFDRMHGRRVFFVSAYSAPALSFLYFDPHGGPPGNRHAILEALLQHGADPNTHLGSRRTLLHFAASYGDVDTVALLLRYGADPNARMIGGYTPLCFAQQDAARLLIARGADINVRNDVRQSALQTLIEAGKTKTALLLIDRGADVNAAALNGCTPLAEACEMQHTQVRDALLQHHANVNAVCDGRTALHMAAMDRSNGLGDIRALLAYGADPSRKDNFHKTPLDYAAKGSPSAVLLKAAALEQQGKHPPK